MNPEFSGMRGQVKEIVKTSIPVLNKPFLTILSQS